MMSIVTAYFDCTDVLKPYLFKFLEQTGYDNQRPHQGEGFSPRIQKIKDARRLMT